MLYLFYGEDDYSVRRRAADAADRHAEAGPFAALRLDGAEATWDDIVGACSVLPFLTSYQVVRVSGLIGASARRRSTDGDAGTKPGASPETLAQRVTALPSTTVLVLEEGALPATNAHLKRLSALDAPKIIEHCPVLEGQARAAWVRDEVARRGGAIAPAAAAAVAERLRGSLWAVSGAIDTLMAYVGPGERITSAAVEEVVTPEDDANAFHLSDAIAAGRVEAALTVLHDLLAGGMAEEQIMAMLTGRVRDWTLAAALRAEKAPESDAIKWLGWNPGKYRMVTRGTALFARGELPRAYQSLVIADEALKSRPGDERTLILDLLVFTLATRGGPDGLRQTFPVPVTSG